MKFFRFWSQAYVLHLEAEIDYLRANVAHERERAEFAIDELLRIRVGAGPVSSTAAREAAAGITRNDAPEDIVRKLLSDTEFATAGETE